MQWEQFDAACPELSRVARDRVARDQLVMVGTLRKDGWPRISPCEVDLAGGHLFIGMMWRSAKALDLARDPRLFFLNEKLTTFSRKVDHPLGSVSLPVSCGDRRPPGGPLALQPPEALRSG